MAPIFLVPISEFLFLSSNRSLTLPYHPSPLPMSFASCLPMSFASFLLPFVGSPLSQVWFQNFISLFISIPSSIFGFCYCYFSLFQSFSIPSFFFAWIFPLFLFFSFKPITRWIRPAEPKNRDKRFWPTVRSTMGEKSIYPTWVGRVTVWPQTRSARPVDSPT